MTHQSAKLLKGRLLDSSASPGQHAATCAVLSDSWRATLGVPGELLALYPGCVCECGLTYWLTRTEFSELCSDL